jgi:hypothetical protein
MGNLWSLLTIVGPFLLAAALVYALMRNRKRDTPGDIARTEAATHRLYDREDAEDHARDNRVER